MIRSLLLFAVLGLAYVVAVGVFFVPAIFGGNDCPDADISTFPACGTSFSIGEAPSIPPLELGEFTPTGVGTKIQIRRVSEPSSSGENKQAQIHSYSRRQAWNSDETLIALTNSIIESDSLETLTEAMSVSSAFNWSNTNPDLIYGIAYNPTPIEFRQWNVRTGETKILRRFERFERCSIGEGEGNLSNDDTFVVIVCEDTKQGQRTLISYDLVKDEILGEMEAAEDLNWASFTQSGKYIVVENSREGGPEYRLLRYSPDLKDELLLLTNPEHGDLGSDNEGEDVFVMIGWENINYVRVRDALRVKISIDGGSENIGYGHLSCRNIKRPGWCYISTYGNRSVGAVKIGLPDTGLNSFRNKFVATKQGVRAYEPWGFHYSTGGDYRTQAKASVSPSGLKIIFTSDWNGQAETSDYILEIFK